jgi:hypothetical protein
VFVEQGALSPADAIPFTPSTPSEAKAFQVMKRSGALRPADGGWWFDAVAYRAHADARSRAAVPWLIAGATVAALLLTLLYRG